MMKRIELLLATIVALLLWILADSAAAGFHQADANIAHDVYTLFGAMVFAYGVIRFVVTTEPELPPTKVEITLTAGDSAPVTTVH